jgi:glycosyltransferase involved in cell wall biosynthesis
VPDLDTVVRPGYVTDIDLRALLGGAAALLYPSRYEGFGTPPLEAWACGTPALVTDIPVLRESTEGRAVYLPPGDVAAWADGIVSAVRGEVATPEPATWSWSDAAQVAINAIDGVR